MTVIYKSLVTETSTSKLTSGTLFTYTGSIEIVSLIGRVSTIIQDQAQTARLYITPDSLSAYNLCAATSIRAFAAGTLLSLTGTVANDLVGTTAIGTIAPAQAGRIIATCVTSGVIGVTFNPTGSVSGSTGAIVWEISWVPISQTASVI